MISDFDIETIEKLDELLQEKFKEKMVVDPFLTRSLVSFQANKTRRTYRWYKFKEAFSASLIELLLEKNKINQGVILDPFAGSGTALFAASNIGVDSVGIELLKIGQEIIETKKIIETEFTEEDFEVLKIWSKENVWARAEKKNDLRELRITRGAYPEETKLSIEKYLSACDEENIRVRAVLRFALFCVLETISFTRKDGQYLRWDFRSDRRQGKKIFNKGYIKSFDEAIFEKISEIIADTYSILQSELFSTKPKERGGISLLRGSCLEILPTMEANTFDAIITSPPYCNRYDYTRTYALELALLDTDEQELIELRQAMLSCTVENRSKDLLRIAPQWKDAIEAADQQELLQSVLGYLTYQKEQKLLNNNGIPRMIRGYFYELACVIFESARVLKQGSRMIMVNDNVRYQGVSISVDLILSDIAERLGFATENILVLPGNKGNSSQQMGEHGRDALRKCVYVWRKL